MTEELPTKLHEQIMLLFEDLKAVVPNEKRGLLLIAEQVFQFMSSKNLMNHVVSNILPHQRQINDKDEAFFLNNKQLFGKLPTSEVDYFGNLVINGGLSVEEKDMIWDYFKVFITFAECYKKDR